jgi:outer membrane protein OmpA-like peptidoglycan-associated protein
MNGMNTRLTSGELLAIFVLSLFFLLGCSAGPQPTATPAPAEPPHIELQPSTANVAFTPIRPPADWETAQAKPFDEALLNSLGSLLSLVELPAPGSKHVLAIDPLIDGSSGVQSVATRRIESRLADLTRKKYPHFSLQPFLPMHLDNSPLVLLGTLTAVNASGYPEGKRESYRICLALADLKSGKVISKEVAKAQIKAVNHTPTPYFLESPAWMTNEITEAYAHTCETSKPGERIPAPYLDGIATRALVGEAIALYDRGHYQQALDRYANLAAKPNGDELRIRNGVYLANLKLGRSEAAAAALSNIVEYGMTKNRLAMNFVFRPGTAMFAVDPSTHANYGKWLHEIARRTVQTGACLDIVGHTSLSGPEPLNEKLSLQRAEYIRKNLEAVAADLTGRLSAQGVGSRENIVGTGKDDLSDSLDRRVVFRVVSCPRSETQTAQR